MSSEKDDAMKQITDAYEGYAERSRFSKVVPYMAVGSGVLGFKHPLFFLPAYVYIGYRVADKMGAEGREKPVVTGFWLPMIAAGLVKKLLWK